MKKYILLLLLAMALLMPSNSYAKEKVKIYLFRGSTCGYCEEAVNYINEHQDEIDKNIEVVTFEVFENDNNYKLLKKVQQNVGLSEDNVGKVPFFVVGTKYNLGYNGPETFKSILNSAKEYIDDSEYEDIIEKAKDELLKVTSGLKFKGLTIEELFPKPSKVVTIVVYSIFGVIVLGFGGMILFSRKR